MKSITRYMLGFIVAFMVVLPARGALPAAGDFVKVDDYVQTFMARNRIPGLSLTVTQGNKIIYSKGYGIAGTNRPMTPDTPMLIGSQSKSFTALAVMQLMEAGQLELDAPLQRYIPWFKVADPQASARITVRSLLNHTSGLSEEGYVSNLSDRTTLEQAVRDLERARPTAAVGEKHQYFNLGYTALGYLVEVISGQTYGEYLRENVFKPLGMTRSSASIEEYTRLDMAQGYTQLFAFPFPMQQPLPLYYLPAGFIVSTTNDLARYLLTMEQGGVLDGTRILSDASVKMMFTANTAIGSASGFGWDISRYYGDTQITHGGATERFYTSVVILPDSELSIAMIINQDHMFKANYDYLQLFWGVVNILTGHPVSKQGISSVTIGWVLLVVFLIVVFFSARGLLALSKQQKRLSNLPARRRWLSILPHTVSIGATSFMVIVAGPSLAGRGFDFRWFTGFYPDIALLVGVVLAAEAIQLIVKLGIILTIHHFEDVKPLPWR